MNTDDHPEGHYVTDIELEILTSEEIGYVARDGFISTLIKLLVNATNISRKP